MKNRKRFLALVLTAVLGLNCGSTAMASDFVSDDFASEIFVSDDFASEEVLFGEQEETEPAEVFQPEENTDFAEPAEADQLPENEPEEAEADEDFLDTTVGTYTLTHAGIYQEGAIHVPETEVVLLPEWEKRLVDYAEDDIFEMQIADLDIPVTEIDDVVMLFLNGHPEYFYLTFDSCDVENGTVTVLHAGNTMARKGVQMMSTIPIRGTLETEVQKALAVLDDNMSDLEKILALHDYLVYTAEYDYANYLNGYIPRQSYTAYGVLVGKTGVCQAYAEAFKLLMDRIGIDCEVISSSEMNHAWNLVELNGSWYHLDATWDDPVWDKHSWVRHEYFMLSDAEMLNRRHSGWVAPSTAESTLYDSSSIFWNIVESRMFYQDGYWYYALSNQVKKRTLANPSDTSAVTLGTVPYSWAESKLVLFNNKIYVSCYNAIYTMNLDGTDLKVVGTPALNNEWIWGFGIYDNEFYYTKNPANTYPNDDEILYRVELNADVPVCFNLTYDLNDGSEDVYVETEERGTTVYLMESDPEWLGYTFLGWNTDPNAETGIYASGDAIVLDRDITLYAIWRQEILKSNPISGKVVKQVALSDNEKKIYMITADRTCEYTFTTIGNADTVGILYDSEGNEIIKNDDYNGRNFKIIRELTEGETYYLQVYIYGAAAGSFTLQVTTDAPENGWYPWKGKWYLLLDGVPSYGWQLFENKYYYMNEAGVMQTGWKLLNNKWYYLGSNGVMRIGWQEIKGTWYYFAGSGAMQTGWQQIGNKWYYFNSDGAMQTGWQQINGKWYYLNSSGEMQTGWQPIGGKWYYFTGSGAMQTGWQKMDSKWYYLNGSGVMQTGWLYDGGSWYFLKDDGSMLTGWLSRGGKWYCFGSNGKMYVGTYVINGKTYRFDQNGVMQ